MINIIVIVIIFLFLIPFINFCFFFQFFIILGHFEITPSGYILVKTALDAEVNSVFSLTIEAKDEGQPRRANSVSEL